jgi:uncharacterized protein (TIGR00661 family)
MNILYGVCGEGMGHAMRSAVVAKHLQSRGHAVRFVSSGGAAKYLEKHFGVGSVTRALGLRTVMLQNRVQPLATLVANVCKQTIAPAAHAASFLALGRPTPDVVVSDFDPWSARYAGMLGVPLVAVDNVHFMNRFTHPRDVVTPDRTAAAIMFPTVHNMVPGAKRYLVTSFVGAPVAAPRTTLHAPIVRPSVLGAPRSVGAHVVVYFNDSADHEAVTRALAGVGARFRVYGQKGLTRERTTGNVIACPFSEERFIEDLGSARAVIGGAGFTLMTEAIALGKPMLAVPFGSQFEQILNANYLERVGYGERARVFDCFTVGSFLDRAPGYAKTLSGLVHDGNRELFSAVEEAIRP